MGSRSWFAGEARAREVMQAALGLGNLGLPDGTEVVDVGARCVTWSTPLSATRCTRRSPRYRPLRASRAGSGHTRSGEPAGTLASLRDGPPGQVLDSLEPLDVEIASSPLAELLRPLYQHLQ